MANSTAPASTTTYMTMLANCWSLITCRPGAAADHSRAEPGATAFGAQAGFPTSKSTCGKGSTFLRLRREPGERTRVAKLVRPPVTLTGIGSWGCAAPAGEMAATQTSRETFAESLRNSCLTVGEG